MKKWILMLLIFGCTPKQDHELLAKSQEVHEEALAVGKLAKQKIDSLKNGLNTLDDSTRNVLLDSLAVLVINYKTWQSSIVEVPGQEHDHDHDHEGHDHHHAPAPDLTPEMAFEVQGELKRNAQALDRRATELLQNLKEN